MLNTIMRYVSPRQGRIKCKSCLVLLWKVRSCVLDMRCYSPIPNGWI